MKAKKRNKQKKGLSKKIRFLFVVAIFSAVFLTGVKYYEEKVMPTVLKTMEHYGIMASTKIIDSSVKSVLSDSSITSEDLYIKTTDANGKLTSLSADTVLINNLCTAVSEAVTQKLSLLENDNVALPAGLLTGFDFLAAKGPKIFIIAFRPAGECSIDYETSFKSEGINQINYQIWINIKTQIIIVNPLTNQNITVTRKVPVVNAYINGDVPESMMYPYFKPPAD